MTPAKTCIRNKNTNVNNLGEKTGKKKYKTTGKKQGNQGNTYNVKMPKKQVNTPTRNYIIRICQHDAKYQIEQQ